MDTSNIPHDIFKNFYIDKTNLCNAIINSMGDGLIAMDNDGRIYLMNHIAETLTGWKRMDAQGRDIADVYQVFDLVGGIQAKNLTVLKVFEEKEMFSVCNRFCLTRKDGSEIPVDETASPIIDENGNLLGAILVFREIGEALAAEAQVAHLATHDELTGLPNRRIFMDRLVRAAANAQRTRTKIAVLYIDINDFKNINDTYGHDFGDKTLQSVGKILERAMRESDTVARLGGDEFCVIVTNLKDDEHLETIVHKIRMNFVDQFTIGELELQVGLSIGSAIFPDSADELDVLLDQADQKMYQNKRDQKQNR